MEYIIVSKIEYVNNQVVYNPFGYTTDSNLVDYIYNNYEIQYINWVGNNKSDLENNIINISEFFTQSNIIYSVNQTTNYMEDLNLLEININDL